MNLPLPHLGEPGRAGAAHPSDGPQGAVAAADVAPGAVPHQAA
jgi:hypothetical protein